MRKLLNTLYISRENAYLSLDGENVVIKEDGNEIGRFPLHTMDSIISFSYMGASPALMGKCCDMGISLSFCSPTGKFLARCDGRSKGNVLLRREQYRLADSPEASASIASMMLTGKLFNSRWVIERAKRDHPMQVDVSVMSSVSGRLAEKMKAIEDCKDLESLRGLEGDAASDYFSVFNQMILRDKEYFSFSGRSRRPPADACNALMSFVYVLLSNMCANAAETVGLDSYVGFLHKDRPGRASLSLDMVEELRPCMGDRFILTLINNRIIKKEDFESSGTNAVFLNDKGRRKLLQSWQEKKKEIIQHPFLKEKIPWGLVPYVQAQLLSRFIRGDIDAYPPFLWK